TGGAAEAMVHPSRWPFGRSGPGGVQSSARWLAASGGPRRRASPWVTTKTDFMFMGGAKRGRARRRGRAWPRTVAFQGPELSLAAAGGPRRRAAPWVTTKTDFMFMGGTKRRNHRRGWRACPRTGSFQGPEL